MYVTERGGTSGANAARCAQNNVPRQRRIPSGEATEPAISPRGRAPITCTLGEPPRVPEVPVEGARGPRAGLASGSRSARQNCRSVRPAWRYGVPNRDSRRSVSGFRRSRTRPTALFLVLLGHPTAALRCPVQLAPRRPSRALGSSDEDSRLQRDGTAEQPFCGSPCDRDEPPLLADERRLTALRAQDGVVVGRANRTWAAKAFTSRRKRVPICCINAGERIA
jgi:hypothetical protein